ncbi:PEP-CTERM sorting domain-containing protein [Floridanema aerugineum]|uniref:PEP-CTERM sorting domain-containing protein n=1 Tax=Floridaenema aerugineum BLCC-F46 TaxID=3153654 RepID=A0ABV4X1J9_9CYAN
MFSQTWQKLFLSATSTTLVALGLTTLSADAVTFNFNGNRIKGSYTVSDYLYSNWLFNISNPQYDQNGIADSTLYGGNGDITDFKLFLDGTAVDFKLDSTQREFLALNNSNRNDPSKNYNYFDLLVKKDDGTPTQSRFSIASDIIASKETMLECILSGKSCAIGASFSELASGGNISETVTHSVVTGSSRLVPISAQQVGDSLMFDNAQSGFWFATPSNLSGNSFELEMAGDAKFNAVSNFLAGLNDSSLFTISVGDAIVGQYKSGDNIDFIKLLGSGVSKFKVTSNQGFTASDLKALSSPTYSSQFIFDRETASFKMTSSSQPNPQPKPVPEPTSALALLIFGGAWMLKRRTSSSPKEQLVSKADSLA